jgi:hypothetical protein
MRSEVVVSAETSQRPRTERGRALATIGCEPDPTPTARKRPCSSLRTSAGSGGAEFLSGEDARRPAPADEDDGAGERPRVGSDDKTFDRAAIRAEFEPHLRLVACRRRKVRQRRRREAGRPRPDQAVDRRISDDEAPLLVRGRDDLGITIGRCERRDLDERVGHRRAARVDDDSGDVESERDLEVELGRIPGANRDGLAVVGPIARDADAAGGEPLEARGPGRIGAGPRGVDSGSRRRRG